MTFQWRNLLTFMLISVVLLWQVFVFLFMTYSKSYQTLLIGEHVWWFKKKIQFIVSMYNSVLLLEISNIFNTTWRKGHNYGCLNCSVHVYHSMVLCQYLIKEGRDLDVHVNVLPEAYWGPLLRLATVISTADQKVLINQYLPIHYFLQPVLKDRVLIEGKKVLKHFII